MSAHNNNSNSNNNNSSEIEEPTEPTVNGVPLGGVGFMTEEVGFLTEDGGVITTTVAYDSYARHTIIDCDLYDLIGLEVEDLGFSITICTYAGDTETAGLKCKVVAKTDLGEKSFEAIVAEKFSTWVNSCIYKVPAEWREKYEKIPRIKYVRRSLSKLLIGMDLGSWFPEKLEEKNGTFLGKSKLTGKYIIYGRAEEVFHLDTDSDTDEDDDNSAVDLNNDIAKAKEDEYHSWGVDCTNILHIETTGKSNECEPDDDAETIPVSNNITADAETNLVSNIIPPEAETNVVSNKMSDVAQTKVSNNKTVDAEKKVSNKTTADAETNLVSNNVAAEEENAMEGITPNQRQQEKEDFKKFAPVKEANVIEDPKNFPLDPLEGYFGEDEDDEYNTLMAMERIRRRLLIKLGLNNNDKEVMDKAFTDGVYKTASDVLDVDTDDGDNAELSNVLEISTVSQRCSAFNGSIGKQGGDPLFHYGTNQPLDL